MSAWRVAACARLVSGLHARVDGRQIAFSNGASTIGFRPGQGGLPTLRLECTASAPTGRAPGARSLTFSDANEPDRAGWREITAVGDRTALLSSTAPATSPSGRLTSYPADLLGSPPSQESAMVRYRDGGPPLGRAADGVLPVAALSRGVDRAGRAFAGLVAGRQLGVPLVLLAVAVAVALGGLHALAPGHGKTVMSAYLVGMRGSIRDAVLIGATVTVTHTAGVLVLGIALEVWSALAPERLYPWLGLLSGLLLAGVGMRLLHARLGTRHRGGHQHPHQHPHPGRHSGDHGHDPERAIAATPTGWRTMLALGFTGGLVPSPSALVVLLGAISVGRAWLGGALVLAYGAGMALVLTGIGLLLVRARSAVELRRHRWPSGLEAAVSSVLPVGTAAVIVIAGLWLALRGAMQL